MLKLYKWKVVVSVKIINSHLDSATYILSDLTLVRQYFKEFTFKKQTPFVHATKFLSYSSQE